jgi:NADPH-dependent glutamate synthase beta subunit-like oxidoreductase
VDQQTRRQLEDRCVQDCAPACASACPVHVDVRAVAAAVGRGDATAALGAFTRSVPFPGIIAHVCDRPCEDVCTYGEIGTPIAIRAIERTCVEHGQRSPTAPDRRPRRSERVAVVGGGISGLTAAHDLARKGYPVTVLESADRLGGRLWRADRDYLPAPVIEADLGVLSALEIEVRLGTEIDVPVELLLGDYEAVYVATGPGHGAAIGLPLDDRGVVVDPVTFATPIEGIFAGGGLLWGSEMHSSITSISEGRRAAISIDRLLQEVSLTASRTGEGPYRSCLITSLEGIGAEPRIEMGHPDDGYEWYEAMLEGQRCLQCQCMECVKACQYLEDHGRYPKKYVREIYNNLSIVKGTRHANTFINSCSACGLCAEVCPTDIDMGAVVLEARRTMVDQGRMPPSAHDAALRDMELSNGDGFALAKSPPGSDRSDHVLFPGCQLPASSPHQVEQLFAHLTTSLPDDDVGLALGCCGAPARWAGRTDLFDATIDRWRQRFRAMGDPTVVLPCSSCFQVFSLALPEVEIVSLWELLDRDGMLPGPASPAPSGLAATSGGAAVTGEPPTVAIHDPCTTRHESGIHDSVRRLVDRLGLAVDELADSRERTTCCSYGGHQWLVDRSLSHRVIDRRIAESDADYVTYCAMCRDFFASRGKRTLHLLDLLFEPDLDARADRTGPGYSQRHANRARLKRGLLKEIWGEDMAGEERYEAIRVRMSEEVAARIEDRLILVEDLRGVIEHAERTGRRFRHQETGRFLACHRPATVTYWVEYRPDSDGAFEVVNAYSHRMEIPEAGRDPR